MDGQEDKLEDCVRYLNREDSVLERNAAHVATEFLNYKGQPLKLVEFLCENYSGVPEQLRFCQEVLDEFGSTGTETFIQDALKNMVLANYDTNAITTCMTKSPQALDEVANLINNAYWRKVIYQLSEKYPGDAFLNSLILKIAESGYTDEIKHLRAATSNLRVFSDVLIDQISTLIDKDGESFERALRNFVPTVAVEPHTYFLTQTNIKLLSDTPGGYAFRVISKELENAANGHIGPDLIRNIRNLLMDTPVTVVNALRSTQPQPGEVASLWKACKEAKPLDPIFLRDPDLLDYLLKNTFVPTANQEKRPELKAKYMYVLAYAASAFKKQDGEVDISKVDETFEVIRSLQEIVSRKNATGIELDNVLKDIWMNNQKFIDTPMASMALIHWIRYLLRETSFYEKHYKQNVVPVPHYLLEEIAERQEFQRRHVFTVYVELFEGSLTLTRDAISALRTELMDRMLYLIKLKFAIPVLRYVEENAKQIKEKLSLYFVEKTLEMIKPPYSVQFYEIMMRIVQPLAKQLDSQQRSRSLIKQFLNDCPDGLTTREAVEAMRAEVDEMDED
ncbi:260_t:CDS:2 [Paraglomus brasilianum]|uniref:260_t:CDS:1 n=1 Tax=Paraglomus brasilianum TaxID=144538 RepID=A0A9N9G128_9GLOM|nr:260_t:CDS:2 [Paraglomus brasilianum]